MIPTQWGEWAMNLVGEWPSARTGERACSPHYDLRQGHGLCLGHGHRGPGHREPGHGDGHGPGHGPRYDVGVRFVMEIIQSWSWSWPCSPYTVMVVVMVMVLVFVMAR